MPGTTTDGPTVSMSFANNFWGKEDAGVHPLLERMHSSKVTSDELKSFYNTRAAIEDEYARKLLSLCRKPLGSSETGSLRGSLDTMRGEVEVMAKAHQSIAHQMKSELEEPLVAFAGGLKERRKIVQNGIEKLLKTKVQQTSVVNKTRDRYEQDCLRIKGYLAQGHMVMGQEERKNKSKMEKTQIQMASDSKDYKAAIEILTETTGRWNREWKSACDKFQDLEEERIDFTKSSLWNFANIASTVCVSDDASCEKIRLSLENCEVEKDISSFISTRGTGQEIPDAPAYIDFCKGDANYSASEASDDEGSYSVAQFQRTMNPAFRTSSPVPSTFSSHHDPNSELAKRMAGMEDQDNTPRSREQTITPNRNTGPAPGQPDFRQQAAHVQEQFRQNAPPDLATVPYNEHPTDGMTMFCRNDGNQSDLSSAHSPMRPGSRDSQSEYSNPTSFSSIEPTSGKASPTKPMAATVTDAPSAPSSPNKTMHKKRSGFFSNSPFRRKSKHEKERPTSFFGGSSSPTKNGSSNSRQGIQSHDFATTDDGEPIDPRASFQLNVGNNVFDVASPESRRPNQSHQQAPDPDDDPIAAALAELKGVTKNSSTRQSADRYAGLATPAPGSSMRNNPAASSAQRGTPPPSYSDPAASMKRLDAPQPAHTSRQMQETARRYQARNEEVYGGARPGSGHNSQHGVNRAQSPLPMRSTSPRPGLGADAYRSTSPRPDLNGAAYRSVSPNPYQHGYGSGSGSQQSPGYGSQGQGYGSQGSASQGQGSQGYNSATRRPRPQSASPQKHDAGSYGRYGRHNSPGDAGMQGVQGMQGAPQPQPQYARGERPSSAGQMGGGGGGGGGGAMALQLSQGPQDGGALGQGQGMGQGMGMRGRPVSYYGAGAGGQVQMHGGNQGGGRERERSKSVAGGQAVGKDGRPILHYARAMYSYTAAIPEELSFQKTDVLAVLRLQDDGWWEAEVTGKKGRPGLVPSNYLQRC